MDFDYIIIGGGMSGLSLVQVMINNNIHKNASILVLETRNSYERDKLWSFWNVKQENYDDIIFNKWKSFTLHSSSSISIETHNMYHSVDSIKFYNKILAQIEENSNITLMMGTNVKEIHQSERDNYNIEVVMNDDSIITGSQVFDSRLPKNLDLGKFDLLQHFKGIQIETTQAYFDKDSVTLMDFRVDQRWGLHFIYVLPISETKAIIEATWFAKDLVTDAVYDKQISNYLTQHGIEGYEITYSEKGVIPMSLTIPEQRFWSNIINIGTRGGLTRPSTGYTFLTAQWYSQLIVHELSKPVENRKIPKMRGTWINFLDEILLRVLTKHPGLGPDIFVKLFKRNDPDRIIRFLSGTSSIADEFVMMMKIPKMWAFVKEGLFATLSRLAFW